MIIYYICNTVHGKHLWEKILVNQAVGEEKFGKLATVSAYVNWQYIFGVSVNIVKENFGK